jgi:hypothetical protein
MTRHLDDLLDRAGRDDAPLVPPAQARADAVRHRTRRRLSATAAVAVVVAGVAVAGQSVLGPRPAPVVPATPSPTATAAPSPTDTAAPAPTTEPAPATTSPPPTTSEPSGPPPLTADEAREEVARLRFPVEARWEAADDVGPTESRETSWWVVGCDPVPFTGDPLAWRTGHYAGPDVSVQRQIVVYEGSEEAAAAFAELRATIRACHASPRTEQIGGDTWTTTVSGGQLDLADESFWVAEEMVITASEQADRVGDVLIYSHGLVLVLDDNVVLGLVSPAYLQEGRDRLVREAVVEVEQFRPAYDDLRRP